MGPGEGEGWGERFAQADLLGQEQSVVLASLGFASEPVGELGHVLIDEILLQ